MPHAIEVIANKGTPNESKTISTGFSGSGAHGIFLKTHSMTEDQATVMELNGWSAMHKELTRQGVLDSSSRWHVADKKIIKTEMAVPGYNFHSQEKLVPQRVLDIITEYSRKDVKCFLVSDRLFSMEDLTYVANCAVCTSAAPCTNPICTLYHRGNSVGDAYVVDVIGGTLKARTAQFSQMIAGVKEKREKSSQSTCICYNGGKCMSCGAGLSHTPGFHQGMCFKCAKQCAGRCHICGDLGARGAEASTRILNSLTALGYAKTLQSKNTLCRTGAIVCSPCMTKTFRQCPGCNQLESIPLYSEDNRCRKCRAVAINEYNYKPAPIFYPEKSAAPNRGTLYMGFELEMELRDQLIEEPSLQQVIATRAMNELHGEAYFKKDSSLSCGFELVTHPCTLDFYHSKDTNIWKVISKLSQTHESFWTSTTGFHIHVSRSAFSTHDSLANFISFFHTNKSFVAFVSQRGANEEYAFWDSVLETQPLQAVRDGYRSDHHSAISTRPEYTVEIRTFKGNMTKRRIIKNLEFVHALWAAIETSKSLPTVQGLITYAKAHPEKYADFIDFTKKYRKEN